MTPSWTRGPTPHRPPDCLTWRLVAIELGVVLVIIALAVIASQKAAPTLLWLMASL